MRISISNTLILAASVGSLLAQAPALQMNVVYQCPVLQATLKVFSCAGPAAGDMCDVQTSNAAQPNLRGKSTRQQVMSILPLCHLQTPAEAKGGPPAAAKANPNQTGAGGFKAGDDVQILTAGGWMDAKVLQVSGNTYRLHAANGADVNKTYPAELRRIGKLTNEDHANGQWDLKDKVQVNVNGKWIEGEVSGYFNDDFDIRVAGGTVHTKVQNLRPSTAPPPAVRAAGAVPKPGLTRCGAKQEGRWELSAGLGGLQIVFRSGKATVNELLTNTPEEFECWTAGEKVFLYKAGDFNPSDYVLDINLDGTLQTPLGELKKKGN